ncbi:MAG TPA: SRPBCC family protein, partial [Myxococcota bacterium]|nr:SRPBCC family protein [Myxococcota bacterium]
MSTVRARAPIPLSREACWQRLRDLSLAEHYVPGVTECHLTTDRQTGVGASRVVRHRLFGDMDETVVRWDEGEGFTIRLHQGDRPARPFREAFFRYELQPAERGCLICTSMTWTLPGGPIGRLLDALVMKGVMHRNVRDV